MSKNIDIEKWLIRTLGHEGAYSNHEGDPGGETKWGISKKSYPLLDIKNLSVQEAAEIYKRDFLEPLRYNEYHPGVGYQLFDLAVHSGVKQAIKLLQKAISVKQDGIIGPNTLRRLDNLSESDLIFLLLAERIEFLTDLPTWKIFGKGWMRRIAANLRYGADDSE